MSTSSDTVAKEGQSISLDGFSAEQLNLMKASAEHHDFGADVDRMMKLIINSLYKNKEIFLRELISNASDALDKIRVLSLTDTDALEATSELAIRIKANKEMRTLHITDTGIGMSKEELAKNLGTIAKSGTAEFNDAFNSSQATEDLIGKFGVGFYSSFLVSDKVTVISKKNGHDQYIWESSSTDFTLVPDPRGNTLDRGTEIILLLKEDASDFLQTETLKSLIKKYSQFVSFPIYLWESQVKSVPEASEETEEQQPKEEEEVSVEEEKKEQTKTVEKTVWDWVHMNPQKPIWKRKPSDITDEEYKKLYQALSNDQDEPLGKIHFKVEGEVPFTAVIFIPKRAKGNILDASYNYDDRIRLYVHKVFISNAAEQFIPRYFSFVVGIVDSDDLPLNVSRETLQQNQLTRLIKKKITRKIIEMISKLSDEAFESFWKEYSVHVKLGIAEDQYNKEKLLKFLRYPTSRRSDKLVSLADYVKDMKENQTAIYYLNGVSVNELKSSPLVERLVKKGYEVLYMTDPVDTYVASRLDKFNNTVIQNVAKEGLSIETSKQADQEEFANLLKWFKEKALPDKIEKAELSARLSVSPAVLVATKYGWDGDTERIMRAQAHHKGNDASTAYYSKMLKILEINPRHPIIKELNSRVAASSSDAEALLTAEILLYTATLRSGFMIHDSVDFAQKIELITRRNLGIDEHEQAESEPEPDLESPQVNQDKPVTDEDLDNESQSDGSYETDEKTSESDEVTETKVAKDEL